MGIAFRNRRRIGPLRIPHDRRGSPTPSLSNLPNSADGCHGFVLEPVPRSLSGTHGFEYEPVAPNVDTAIVSKWET